MNKPLLNLADLDAASQRMIQVRLTSHIFDTKFIPDFVGFRLLVEVLDNRGDYVAHLDVTPLGIPKRGVYMSIKEARQSAQKICDKYGWPFVEDVCAMDFKSVY